MRFNAAAVISTAAVLAGSVHAHGDHGKPQSVLKEAGTAASSAASDAASSTAPELPTFTVSSFQSMDVISNSWPILC
jgi:hypothetical protein